MSWCPVYPSRVRRRRRTLDASLSSASVQSGQVASSSILIRERCLFNLQSPVCIQTGRLGSFLLFPMSQCSTKTSYHYLNLSATYHISPAFVHSRSILSFRADIVCFFVQNTVTSLGTADCPRHDRIHHIKDTLILASFSSAWTHSRTSDKQINRHKHSPLSAFHYRNRFCNRQYCTYFCLENCWTSALSWLSCPLS